ncbi:hypothetical protein MHYP_G00161120 [Metynnis hypsauchen]
MMVFGRELMRTNFGREPIDLMAGLPPEHVVAKTLLSMSLNSATNLNWLTKLLERRTNRPFSRYHKGLFGPPSPQRLGTPTSNPLISPHDPSAVHNSGGSTVQLEEWTVTESPANQTPVGRPKRNRKALNVYGDWAI